MACLNVHVFFFAFITVFGFFPNGLVCLTFWKFNKLLKKPKNILICSIAFSDLLQSILALPIALEAAISGKWNAGASGCQFYAFVCCWCGLVSILLLAASAAERYLTLSSRNLTHMPQRRMRAFVVFAYVVSFIVSGFPLFGWSEYVFEGNGLHCSVDFSSTDLNHVSFTVFLLLAFFGSPFVVIVFCGYKVFLEVRLIYRHACATWGKRSPFTINSFRSEVRTVKVVTMTTIAFLFAWFPYVVVVFMKLGGVAVSSFGSELPALMAKSSLTFNPIIYFFMYKCFRSRALHLIGSLWTKLACKQSKRFREGSFLDRLSSDPQLCQRFWEDRNCERSTSVSHVNVPMSVIRCRRDEEIEVKKILTNVETASHRVVAESTL